MYSKFLMSKICLNHVLHIGIFDICVVCVYFYRKNRSSESYKVHFIFSFRIGGSQIGQPIFVIRKNWGSGRKCAINHLKLIFWLDLNWRVKRVENSAFNDIFFLTFPRKRSSIFSNWNSRCKQIIPNMGVSSYIFLLYVPY